MPLPLPEIQGFILRSYGMDALRCLLFRVDSAPGARMALGQLPVTSSAPWERKPDFCLNVAITFEGLQALGLPAESLGSYPAEFAQGAVARAEVVGDTGRNSPDNWKPAFRQPGVHVIVLVFAQSKDILELRSQAVREMCGKSGAMTEVFALDGLMLPGLVAHFGYRDGFSQPTIEGGLPNPVPDILPQAPAGEFLLGYLSQFGQFSYAVPAPAELGVNGSFLALRILEQDCAGFDKMIQEAPTKYGINGELLAAKMCGRWRNGVPLAVSPETDSPPQPMALDQMNRFDYVPTPDHPETYDDTKGYRCPVGSHMRRTNPRSSRVAGGGGLKHRIVRRGLPYGPPYDPANPNDGIERGLLGLFIGASLKDQFEFLMSDWVNGDSFAAGLHGTLDPVLGNSGDGGGTMIIPVEGGQKLTVSGFSQFVTTRGGAYAFIPSLPALQYIASLP